MTVYVPKWLQETFDRVQGELACQPRENLPHWLQRSTGTLARREAAGTLDNSPAYALAAKIAPKEQP